VVKSVNYVSSFSIDLILVMNSFVILLTLFDEKLEDTKVVIKSVIRQTQQWSKLKKGKRTTNEIQSGSRRNVRD
jgi:hypothetical protein